MRFYKLTSVLTGEDYYIRPDLIDFYKYTDDGVLLRIKNMRIEVSKADFTNMLILEGVDEYWTNNLTWLSYYYIIN